MDAVLQLSTTVGIESACDALGVARASFYRQRPLLGPTDGGAPFDTSGGSANSCSGVGRR